MLVVDDVPAVVGVVVAEGEEGLLEGLGAGAGEADADDLHWLGGGAGSWRWGVAEGVDVVFEDVPEGVVEEGMLRYR